MIDEKRIFIKSSSDIVLEALINEGSKDAAVLVAHPHPLYGGDMYNNVVEALIKAYQDSGYTTLRFNFRGVGRSGGSYDNGIGEREDVKAVFKYILDMGKDKIAVSGYSFGAWVIASCIKELETDHIVMVSPPVSMIDFSFLEYDPRIRLVITGSYDDIAPPDMIKDMLPKWNPDAILEIIDGADHFYWGWTNKIEDIVKKFLREIL